MKSKALLAATALILSLSAVSCNDKKKNPPETAYGESVRTTAAADTKEETTASGTETETVSAETIEMPDITGMKADLAEDLLRMLGLEYETVNSPDAEIQQGFVIKTEPEADTEIKTGEMVTVYVSTGADAG